MKYSYKIFLIILMLLGCCLIWEAAVPETVPEWNNFHSTSGLDPYYCSNGYLIVDGHTHKERFIGLSNALAILDETNPTVANWVRSMNDRGDLVFEEDKNFKDPCINAHRFMAKFNFLDRKLYLHKGIFAESDGHIAVTLGHEYRHSRQSYTKLVRYTISTFFTENGAGNANLMEEDAVLYEMQGFSAIFGPGYAD